MKWNKSPVDPALVRELSRRYGVDLLVATIFSRRSIVEPSAVRAVLEDDARSLHNPFLMPGMADAVERIEAAIESGERILVFGDRDVDGITATVLAVEALRDLGAEVAWALPEGEESYGLSSRVIADAAAAGVRLLVTVDCGISNRTEIAEAAGRGLDTIVVDHHNVPASLPEAAAVIDPKLPGYPFRDLAGVAVASKLEWALRFSRSPFYGASVCLLNARPANETVVIEAVRLRNLVETGRIAEDIVPGVVPFEQTRLAKFVAGDEALVLDGPAQARLLTKAFGDADLSLSDLSPLVRQFLPSMAGRTLIRMRQESREERYRERPSSEIDTLAGLFRDLVLERERERMEPWLRRMDLVALGTLADLMPLVDENRVLVRRGLEVLRTGERRGLRQLLVKKDLLGRRVGAAEVAWQLAPLLNSAGRMGEPQKATRLFLTEPLAEVESLVDELMELDSRRRAMGESVWQTVLGQARESFERTGGRCVLVHDERVPRGITGVTASRLQGYFKVPAIVISLAGDPVVGSVRAAVFGFIEGFFNRHRALFASCGGHDFAGGFSLERARLDRFLAEFQDRILEVEPTPAAEAALTVDAEIPLRYLTPDLLKVVDLFEPYGEANPQLVFTTRGLRIAQCEPMGRREQSHLKLLLEAGSSRWPAVYWNAASRFPGDFAVGDTVEAAYRLERTSWGAVERLRLNILDMRR